MSRRSVSRESSTPSTVTNKVQRRCTRCNMPMKGHPRGRDKRLICQVQAPEQSESSFASGSQLNADPFLSSQNPRNFSPRYSLPGVPGNQVHLPPNIATTSAPQPYEETEYDGSPPPENVAGPSKIKGTGSFTSGFLSALKRTPTPYPLSSLLSNSRQREQPPEPDPDNLPAIGMWDRKRRDAWSQPPTIEEMQEPLTIQNAPTELVNSIGDPLDIGDPFDDENNNNGGGGRDLLSTSPWRLLRSGSGRATMCASPIPEYNNRFPQRQFDESTRARDLLRVVEHPPIYAAIPATREEVPMLQKWAETNNLNTHIVHNPTNFTRRSIFKTPESSSGGGGNGGPGGDGGNSGGKNWKGKGKETETNFRGNQSQKPNPLRGEPSWTVVVGQNRMITNRVSDLTYRLIMRPFASEGEILAEPILFTPRQFVAIASILILFGVFVASYFQLSLW